MGKRREFADEYRRDVAGLVIDGGRMIVSVASELYVGEQLLGRWVRVGRERREGEVKGEAALEELKAQIHELSRENLRLRMENEF
ncbi:transposase [Gleimia hominis]|uniref:transposase n=1 Tax=Gleimia hominis TaxID=595468 RepID=UPI000C80C756|nr:transposase [Gleimia hominis]WIK63932.1 transposase [Gleimia hominis]